MFVNEAKWILNKVKSIKNDEIYPILNIGSSTLEARLNSNPNMEECLYFPLSENGKIIHADIKSGIGIDIVGDLTDPKFIDKLKTIDFKLILCNNLLEHINNPQDLCYSLTEIAKSGTYILVSVPYRYPYHFDPIDTMFRPTPEKLIEYFPRMEVISKEIVKDTRTYYNKLSHDKALAKIIFIRSFLPFYKPKMWWNTVRYFPYMFVKFKVTCILLKKK